MLKSCIALCHFLLVLPAAVLAKPTCPPDPIRLDFFEFGLLYASSGAAKPATGIDRDLVDELIRRSGCRFEAYMQPRARTWVELKAGRVDMTLSGLSTPERERYAWFLPYLQLRQIVLLGAGAPAGIKTLADFQATAKLKFGIVRGYRHSSSYEPLIAQWAADGRVVEYVDDALLIDALKQGAVAAMLSYPAVYHRYLAPEDWQNALRIADWDTGSQPTRSHFVLSKEKFSEADARQWGQLLKEIRQDGTLLRILKKYFSTEEAEAMLP